MPRSRWDEDDDDYYPVYKGARNYESVGAKVGEAFSDLAVSVRRAAGNVLDDPAVSKKAAEAGKTWEKAKKAVFGDEDSDDDRRVASGLPANCFCDMRGFACPRHRGREKWRFAQDYKLHVKHNVEADGSSSETALGGGGKLAGATFGADVIQKAQDAAGIAARDADMAQLVQMGFDPDKVARALAKHKTLEAATNALLDDPDSAARDEAPGSQLPEPPSAPPPKPPGASFSGGAAASRGVPVLGAPPGGSAGPVNLSGLNLISLEEMDSSPAAAPPVPAAATARPAYADLDPMSARFPLQPSAPLRPPPVVMVTAGGMPLMMPATPAVPLAAPPPMQPPMLLQGFGGGSMRRMGAVPHMDGQAPRGPTGYAPDVAPGGYHSGGPGPMGMPHGCPMSYPHGGGATAAGGLIVPRGGMGMPTPHASALAPHMMAQMPGAPRLTPPDMATTRVAPGGVLSSAAPAYAPTGAVSGGCVSASLPSLTSLGSALSTDEGSDGLPAWLSTAEANLSTLAAAVPHTAAAASAPWQAAPAASAVAPWIVGADPATARAYYYNTVTKESQWEPPRAAAADSDAPVALGASAAAPAPAAAAGALPAGWQSGIDPKSGVVYYCNPNLNVTQWAHPAETTAR